MSLDNDARLRRLEYELLRAEARIRSLLAHIGQIDPDYVEGKS